MMMTSGANEVAVPRSVGRALDLLEIVVAAGETNLSSAASEADLTPTTALRHLRALEARGYVRRAADGRYSAGPTVLRLATAAQDDGPYARLIAAARPVLDELTDRTGESAYLSVSDGRRAVYLATSESRRSIRHVGWVGKTVPLAGTAVGEALAGAPGPRTRSGSVEADITAVARGVGGDASGGGHDDRRGGGHRVVAALSIIGPSHRMDRAAVDVAAEALEAGADRLAAELGLVRAAS